MDHCQDHGDGSHPASLVLQDPRQLLHAAVDVRVARHSVTALLRQWMSEPDKVIGTVSTAATDLQNDRRLDDDQRMFSSRITYVLLDKRQRLPTGLVIGCHDQPTDRVLQDGLNAGIRGTVVQQQRRSHNSQDEGEDLRGNELKVRVRNKYIGHSQLHIPSMLTISNVTEFSIRALQHPRKEVTITMIPIAIRM